MELRLKLIPAARSVTLILRHDKFGNMNGSLYFKGATLLAFATASHDRTRIVIKKNDCCIWIGSASFDLTPADAEHIAATFSLRLDREEPASPAVDGAPVTQP